MRDLQVGDPVLLTLDSPGKVGITMGMWKYKDRRFRICKVKKLFGGGATNVGTYYELKGCVSKHGIPYSITPDWVRLIKEVK